MSKREVSNSNLVDKKGILLKKFFVVVVYKK